MGTEVQFKVFYPGYHFANDVNEKAGNRSVQLSCDNISMKNGNQLNGFSRCSTSDIHCRSEKEELRQMILKQEAIFRHQLHELHRVYKTQKDLMNEIKSKDLSKSLGPTSTFQSHSFSSSDKSKQHVHHLLPGFLESGRIPTSGEAWVASESRVSNTVVRRLFDLELPADEYITEEQKVPPCAKSQRMEHSASTRASFNGRVSLNNLKTLQPRSSGSSFFGQSLGGEISSAPLGLTQVEFKKILEPVYLSSNQQISELQKSRKIFGIEISERNQNGSQLSLQQLSTGSNMNFMKSTQGLEITEHGLLVRGPREGGGSYQMSTDSLLSNFHQFVGTNKKKCSLPCSLVQEFSSVTETTEAGKMKVGVNGCSGDEKTLGPYADRSHSAGGFGSSSSNLMDNSISPNFAASAINYRVEVEQFEKKMNARSSGSREFLDLNVCPAEEEASSALCSETFDMKLVKGEIDLEVPVLETNESPLEESSDSKQGSSVMLEDNLEQKNDEVLRVAAGTLVTISSVSAGEIRNQIFPDKPEDTQNEILQWFVEVVISKVSPETDAINHGEYVPEGMDSFEFATLNLAETEVEKLTYKPPVSEELQEDSYSRRPQKGQARRGRQKRDFQRDVLPGMTSLSRYEVTEDLQMIEGMIKATGRASRQGLPDRNGASRGTKARGRTNKRNCTSSDPINPRAVQKPKCRELGIDEGALTGWGKRARRPKRPRCSTGMYSLSLKEVC